MKKVLLVLLVFTVVLMSCGKDTSTSFDASAQAAIDDGDIQTYLKSNSISATKDISGLYYQIVTAGTGASPSSNSVISVNYSGKYLDGTSFTNGSQTLNLVALASLIAGWQIGIPYDKVGGRIILYIPSALGYGHTPPSALRPDAVLIFTIDLTAVK